MEAGGVVVVVVVVVAVGRACGRGGGWSGGWEGLVVAFLVGFVICVWFGCGLQGLEVEMRWGGWRCFVVLWRGEGEGEVKGSTLSPRDANPQAASRKPVTMKMKVPGHPELDILLGFCGLFAVSCSAGIGSCMALSSCDDGVRLNLRNERS